MPYTPVSMHSGHLLDSRPSAIQTTTATLALTSALLALWMSTHRYHGLSGDAALYAMQALARIQPNLLHDVFLEHTSQDSYTIFSPLYAGCIALWGLHTSALILTITFKLWFFAAAWTLARSFSQSHVAFVSVGMLIIVSGAYGAYSVFRYAEDWVTARSLGEAMVITAFAFHFRGWRIIGLLCALGALIVHPLMALPGLLVLVCLWSSSRITAICAGALVLLALGVAIAAIALPSTGHFLAVMDAEWLEVVRERSQFLFLQLWSAADWNVNARPFASLTLSWLVLDNPRIRSLCTSSVLVGATGLTIAVIASLIGPIDVLLQGQAWRWVWVTAFVSVLLLPPTVLAIWRDEKCGSLCVVLLISAWTIPAIDGAACIVCALALWSIRERINARAAWFLRLLAFAGGGLILAWILRTCWAFAWSPPVSSAREGRALALIRDALGVTILTAAIFWSLVYWLKAFRSAPALLLACGVFLSAGALLWPETFSDRGVDGTSAQIQEFADWRSAIPPNSNVLVAPAHNAATFVWFTLDRPSYLTVDQSSGVVFSRTTALEIRRRSEVLLPLMDPDWTLYSNMQKTHRGTGAASISRPLTHDTLIRLCADPQLNFVVARESIGFQPIRHTHPGNRQDWNLYDCRRVHG